MEMKMSVFAIRSIIVKVPGVKPDQIAWLHKIKFDQPNDLTPSVLTAAYDASQGTYTVEMKVPVEAKIDVETQCGRGVSEDWSASPAVIEHIWQILNLFGNKR